MARPRKLGLDYFPHDCDASQDEKIECLRRKFGNDGYAFYFIMLERIYRGNGQFIMLDNEEIIAICACKVGVSEEKFLEILAYALKIGLFSKNDYEKMQMLTSNGVKKRSEVVLEKRKRQQAFYLKRLEENNSKKSNKDLHNDLNNDLNNNDYDLVLNK